MNSLIQQGKILYWGTSEWANDEILAAYYFAEKNSLIAPVMEQPQYNMFERNKMEKEYLEVFKNVGMGTTIWSPLASGLLSGKYNSGMPQGTRLQIEGMDWLKERTLGDPTRIDKTKQLSQIALDLGISMSELAIAWCLKNSHVSTAILGASKTEQLSQTLKSVEAVPLLTDSVMQSIEQILQNKPVLPAF